MSFIAVVPARLASARLPEKPLLDLCGKPMVVRTAERARASAASRVLVATDHPRVQAAAAEHGFEGLLTRADHPTGTDRLAEVVQRLALPDDTVLVNVQGDEPLIEPALIDALAAKLTADRRWEMATAACPIGEARELAAPGVVKVVTDRDDAALYFSRLPIPFRRDGPADLASGLYWRHLGIYAYRGDFLNRLVREPPCLLEQTEMLEQLRALHLGARIAVIRTGPMGVGVDTPEDVGYLEAELRRRGRTD